MAADGLLEMVFEPKVRIVPTAGDYFVLDTKAAGFIRHVIFHEPEEKGKGLTLVPTVDGNILIGPTERNVGNSEFGIRNSELFGPSERPSPVFARSEATWQSRAPGTATGNESEYEAAQDGSQTYPATETQTIIPHSEFRIPNSDAVEGFATAHEGMEQLRELVSEVAPTLSLEHIIRSFGAIRPNPFLARKDKSGAWVTDDKSVSDFCIIESDDGMFVSLIGVKTPGLTCANELGMNVAGKIAARLGAMTNSECGMRNSELSSGPAPSSLNSAFRIPNSEFKHATLVP